MVRKTKGTPDEIDKLVGRRLRQFRDLKGWSQEKIANSVGVTFQQVQKYERGTNRISASRLYTFSKLLDVSLNSFYEEEGPEDKAFLTDVQLKILKYFEKAEKKHLKEIKIISKAFT